MEIDFEKLEPIRLTQESGEWRYHIPNGYTAEIVDGFVVIRPEESEDERIRKAIIELLKEVGRDDTGISENAKCMIAYLERHRYSPMPEDTVIFQKGVEEGRRLEREVLPYWQTFKGIGIIVPDDYILAKFGKGYKLLRPGDTIEIGTEFLQVSQLDNLPNEEQQKEQKPRWEINNPHTTKWTKEMIDEKFEELVEKKHAEKQDYSGLNDLERAIFRGFLCAGVENVPIGIIKDTASECIGFLLARIEPTTVEWSKEDKRKLNRIYAILGQAADTHAYSTSCRLIGDKEAVELQDFLRSIAKPKSGEWSEEDDRHRSNCLSYFNGIAKSSPYYEDYLWLKSLKNRGNSPKSNTNSPSWKPSKEQMRCLQTVVQEVNKKSLMSTTGYSPAAVLQSLYIDLKALM